MGVSVGLQSFSHDWSFDLMAMMGEESGAHQSDYNTSSANHECLYKITRQSIQ